MKTSIFALLLCSNGMILVTAQSVRYNLFQPYILLSAYSQKQNDPFSFTGNQASLAQAINTSIGVYGQSRFMLPETSAYTLAASIPTHLGNFGLQLNYAGFKNFTENKIGLAYALKLGKKVDVGLQFNYYGYHILTYGSASAINFEIGTMLHFSEHFNAGIYVYNPVGGNLGKNKEEKLASVYKLGLGYDASDIFFICGEIIKEENKAVNIIAGFQYHFVKQFFAKAGFISESGTVYVGSGVGLKNMRLDISTNYHPQLGFSSGILFMIYFKTKTQ